MFIFGNHKKKSTKEPPRPKKNEKTYYIPYSKSFRGFKRFAVSVHGDAVAEKNNSELYSEDLSGYEFKFVCVSTEYGQEAVLYIDNRKIGTVSDSEFIYALEKGYIEKIHSEPKEEVIIGKHKTENRYRLTFFVKYSNEYQNT